MNWISNKLYKKFEKMSEQQVLKFLEVELIKQAKLMIPDLKYGSIVSGGIDSTLQTKILSKIKKPDFCLSVFHKDKDKIMKYKKKLFEDRLGLKIKTLNFDKNKYYKNLSKCYQITKSPLFTHDLPSRLFLSREFKKNKCKVFFNADGCDELLGGQQIYLNLFKKVNIFNSNDNHSPYSSIKKKNGVKFLNKFQTIEKDLNTLWSSVFKKYSFLNPIERNIQSSLFLDYFYQSINVANKSNDLICCHNSIEPRNIFIQKNILKIFINLPLKHKFNLKEKDKRFIQKGILKKIFIKFFEKKLLLKKEGFSGYPNSVKQHLEDKFFKKIQKTLQIKIKKSFTRIPKDLEWKLINLTFFLMMSKQNR